MASPKAMREALVEIFNRLGGDGEKMAGPSITPKSKTFMQKESEANKAAKAIDKKQFTDTADRLVDPNFKADGFEVNELATPQRTPKRQADIDEFVEDKRVSKMEAEAPIKDTKAEELGVFDEAERELTLRKEGANEASESFEEFPRPLPKDAGSFTHFQELENLDQFMKGENITKLRTKGYKGTKDPKMMERPDDVVSINERRLEEYKRQLRQLAGKEANTPQNREILAEEVIESDVADLAAGQVFGKDKRTHPGKINPESQEGSKDNFSLRQLEDIFEDQASPQGEAIARVRKEASQAAQRSGRTRGPDQLPLQLPTKTESFKRRHRPNAEELAPVQEKLTGPLMSSEKLRLDKVDEQRLLKLLEQKMGRQLKGEQAVGQSGPEPVVQESQLLLDALKSMIGQ